MSLRQNGKFFDGNGIEVIPVAQILLQAMLEKWVLEKMSQANMSVDEILYGFTCSGEIITGRKFTIKDINAC